MKVNEKVMSTNKKLRCAIIGAGMSGLCCARWALAYGVEPVVFEQTAALGGLWHYKSEDIANVSSVMKSTTLNTSKELTAFSDFPPPASTAPFMHNREMLAYLEAYAQHHNIKPHIRFRHRVLNVVRAQSYPSDGQWNVRYGVSGVSDGRQASKLQEELTETFDCVLLAEGHHAKPNFPSVNGEGPQWPGQTTFNGRILHSHSYRDPITDDGGNRYRESVTVVVGLGNSAVDVAVELSRICKQVYLSTRRGGWILPRLVNGGGPIDMQVVTRFKMGYLSRVLPRRFIEWLVMKQLQRHFNHAKYGLAPQHCFTAQHATVSDELPSRIASGTVRVKPNIRRFLPPEDGIEWEDGSVTPKVDNVILCTGYVYDFELIEEGKLIAPVVQNRSRLYKYMFPTELLEDGNGGNDRQRGYTFAVVGLVQGNASLVPIAEMQARLFFHQLLDSKGRLKVSVDEAEKDIQRKEEAMRKRFMQTNRHTLQVDYVGYMDELAKMIGCHPSPMRYTLSDPLLAYRLIFHANLPYAYRLRGPHSWAGARAAIFKAQSRTDSGLKDERL